LLLLYIKRESVFHCTHTAPPPSSFSFLFFRHTRSLDGSCTRRKWNICVCFLFCFVRGAAPISTPATPTHKQQTNKTRREKNSIQWFIAHRVDGGVTFVSEGRDVVALLLHLQHHLRLLHKSKTFSRLFPRTLYTNRIVFKFRVT
jgi:hypothetical protein